MSTSSTILDRIPDPETIERRLAEIDEEAATLRQVLRVLRARRRAAEDRAERARQLAAAQAGQPTPAA
jgi:hypothetical protein